MYQHKGYCFMLCLPRGGKIGKDLCLHLAYCVSDPVLILLHVHFASQQTYKLYDIFRIL